MDKVIIIPIHNQLPHLIRCIQSIFAKTKDFELILVDDGSTDKEMVEWLDNNRKPLNYVLIRNKKAKGFSSACNLGIDYAMQHYNFRCLCLLNSDTRIETEDWFDKVENCFKSDPKVGIAGVMSDHALAQSARNVKLYLSKIESKPTVYSYLIHGFCYFISQEVIWKIGHLDEDLFPHYGSEDDYSLKALSFGFHNLLIGNVFVWHDNETSYSKEKRSKIVSKSFPDLTYRWNPAYINRIGIQSAKAGQYVNNK